MKWINKLDRKYHNKGIPNLIAFILLFKAVAYVLSYLNPTGQFIQNIVFHPTLFLSGQVWRAFTFIATPPAMSPLFVIFWFMLIYTYGQALEHEWGTFRFNLFFLIGYLGTIIASFIGGGFADTFYIELSLFWAFAMIYPDFTLRLYFIIPIKIKYLALISGAFTLFGFFTTSITGKVTIIMSLLNFFIFFSKDIFEFFKRQRGVAKNRKKFQGHQRSHNHLRVVHRCAVCGVTEQDDPHMDFRYCTQCDGVYEYCTDHLRDHEHVKEKPMS